jgi:hypothetical protein
MKIIHVNFKLTNGNVGAMVVVFFQRKQNFLVHQPNLVDLVEESVPVDFY